jgi:hypothetical protein
MQNRNNKYIIYIKNQEVERIGNKNVTADINSAQNNIN